MARPKQIDTLTKLHIRMSLVDKKTIEQQASTAGITFSEFVRRAALGKKIRSRMSAKAVGELSRLGGLQKHLLMEIKAHPHENQLRGDLNKVLAALHDAIKTVSASSVD